MQRQHSCVSNSTASHCGGQNVGLPNVELPNGAKIGQPNGPDCLSRCAQCPPICLSPLTSTCWAAQAAEDCPMSGWVGEHVGLANSGGQYPLKDGLPFTFHAAPTLLLCHPISTPPCCASPLPALPLLPSRCVNSTGRETFFLQYGDRDAPSAKERTDTFWPVHEWLMCRVTLPCHRVSLMGLKCLPCAWVSIPVTGCCWRLVAASDGSSAPSSADDGTQQASGWQAADVFLDRGRGGGAFS